MTEEGAAIRRLRCERDAALATLARVREARHENAYDGEWFYPTAIVDRIFDIAPSDALAERDAQVAAEMARKVLLYIDGVVDAEEQLDMAAQQFAVHVEWERG